MCMLLGTWVSGDTDAPGAVTGAGYSNEVAGIPCLHQAS